MKSIYTLLLLTIFVTDIFAITWKYDIKDTMQKTVDKRGKQKYSINIKIVDYFITEITPYARQYPPKFKNKEDQKDITKKLYQLSKILEVLVHNEQNNIDILNRAAFVNNMAHNVNIKGSSERSKKYYEKSLSINSKSKKMNYQYGMFLVNTKTYHYDSIPYLEKALKLGKEDARYTLGLLYIHQGDKVKGMNMLQEYSADNPKNKHVKKVIQSLKAEKLTFETK